MYSTPSHKIYLKGFAQNQQNPDTNVRWIPSTSHPQEYKGREGWEGKGREGKRREKERKKERKEKQHLVH